MPLTPALPAYGERGKLTAKGTNMETTTLKVEGMSCGGCVKSVTNVLCALPGVAKAEVSLELKSACVEFEPGKTTREDMKRVIVDAGFEAE